MPYYGLYIPNSGSNSTNCITSVDTAKDLNKENETDVSAFVFQKKSDAIRVLKCHKDARFKEFLTEEEAIKYAQTGFEIVQSKYNDVKNSAESLEKAAFRAPTRQQLTSFRQYIEYDDSTAVKNMIWDNPRYLVSSGDTPTILKEGYRYNAMHVCAVTPSPKSAKVILDTVSDEKFTDLLMGKKSDGKSCKELCANLLDYYLNMPEKGRNETPLHLASKFGHVEIVKILVSYPECKMLRNHRGMLPRHMIAERKNIHLSYEIQKLLDERYYVPVIRSTDSAMPGQIGEPFSSKNPPNLNCDPLTPEVGIKALAGPMSEEEAKKFFRRWKTPPRIGSNMSSPIANNPYISPMKPHNSTPFKTPRAANTGLNSSSANNIKGRSLFNSTPQRRDQNGIINTNGVEKSFFDDSFESKNPETNKNEFSESNNNNHLDKQQFSMFKTSLFPLTPLFKSKKNSFLNYREPNVSSPIVNFEGHDHEVNDSLLNVSEVYDSPGFRERHVKNTDIDKGLECIGRVLAKEKNIEWSEYWDFLECFVDIASERGLRKLEYYLAQRQKEQDKQNEKSLSKQKPDIMGDVCIALENTFRKSATITYASTTHQSITPYTYVEKSLQVHAKRMTKTIIHNIDDEVSIIDSLLLELRRIKSLIYSFKEDLSFSSVNFGKVHSRIGNLVSLFLENSQEVPVKMKLKILSVLQNISVEQDEKREHMQCVCSRIVENLKHPTERILPENVKTEEMCSKIWSQEIECTCQWESNLFRKTSHKNRMEARYQRHLLQKQQEKMQKEIENQQKSNNRAEEWRKDVTNDSSDEEVFWSDFGGSDSEEDDVFLTPKESLSRLSDEGDEDSNKIFIYGNEPTKRDLDVLNAIFHVNIDKTKYPNIHSWKTIIMQYPNEEMDLFPSPRTAKKSHSFMATSSNKRDLFVQPQTPTSTKKSYSIVRSNTSSLILNSSNQQTTIASAASLPSLNSAIIKDSLLQLPMGKRLPMSPGRTKSMTAISLQTNSNDSSNATNTLAEDDVNIPAIKLPIHNIQMQRPLTPLNKPRGLFSAYRECLDNSPHSNSSTSP